MSKREPLADLAGAAELQRRLEPEVRGKLLFDAASRGRYATDASIYQIMPVGVLVPETEDDVRSAMQVCAELGVPVLPRGAGTSQCGQTVGAALVIDNSKFLNQLLDVDAAAQTATVQPGMVLDHLNAALKKTGLWFPVDVSTGAQCTLGGMAGNNSCGSRSIVYGNMVHNVASIEALLADGRIATLGPVDRMQALPASSVERGLLTAVGAIAERERDEIAARWPKVLRRVGGYNLDIFSPQSELPYTRDGVPNLAHLLVGSEGTLAYFRKIGLKLSPIPQHRVLGVVNFPDFYTAMDSAQHIVKLGPAAVELVDRTMIELSRDNPALRPVIETVLVGEPDALLLVEFAGDTHADLLRQLARLQELMGTLGLPDHTLEFVDATRQKQIWEVRKAGLNIMMSMRGDGKPVSFIEDCAVPLEHLAEYTARLTEVFARYGTRGTWYAHASVGTLHVRPVLDMRRQDATKMRAIAEHASALVREYKGAYSGEHGDGLCRSEWVNWQFGDTLTRAFEDVKAVFDPKHLLNPGKIVAPPKMDDERLFRFSPEYRVIPVKTALDWSEWNVRGNAATGEETAPGTGDDPANGFAKAVEMCNNNGHCRKFDAGTMCPSYRVTRDERDVTRGRANTLRLALSGKLGPDGLTSPGLYDTMSLCVGCKGCKRECPTGVDMARMKTEFLSHYHAVHPRSAKDKLVASLPRYARLASRLPWLFNLRNGSAFARHLSERLLGFSARRRLPAWRAGSFLSQAAATHAGPTGATQTTGVKGAPGTARAGTAMPPGSATHVDSARQETGEVVLFVDTFNNYFEHENAAAARDVLAALGYTVRLATPASDDTSRRSLCCGRTYLASGMVDEARREARRVVAALAPYARRGVAIVGLEPSCLLTLRDEYLSMGLGADAQAVAGAAVLFEEFLAQPDVLAALAPLLKPLREKKAYLHGHCHQKAFDAVSPVQRLLKTVPGLEVELIETSCCGMAGSFGYDARYYDVSMKMAEASLLPATRRAVTEGALIVADGTSCRHQIADGAGAEAVHAARVIAQSIRG